MKRILVFLMIVGLVFVSCDKNKSIPEQKGELNVENVISVDRQDMFMNYKQDYRWYETCIALQDYLDSECASDTITSITSVFQTISEQGDCIDTKVILTLHTLDTNTVEVKHGFWVDDLPLNQEAICLTFTKAYEKMMESNFPKPHSKQCVLRKPFGPTECNPQYIFGNIHYQLYVDTVTGEVNDQNPAFSNLKSDYVIK